jgi:hypothetical protein
MTSDIIKLLQSDNWYNLSKEVEIAKGKYQYVSTWKQFTRQLKRIIR